MTSFVRGYIDPTPVYFNVSNIDDILDVVAVTSTQKNFGIKMLYTDGDIGVSDPHTVMMETAVEIDDVLLKATLDMNDTLEFSGTLFGLVERSDCSSVQYLCVKVVPGRGSSFAQHAGSDHITCIDIIDLVNCEGKL